MVTVAVRFPLGRYHATPWDRSVNEGAVEWPPSPWRLLRALVATWYTRWPDPPAPVLDGLLDALGSPLAYRTPEVRPGHTRHYLPDPNHKKGETGNTDLTLDPYLRVDPNAELLIRWDAELTTEQRGALAKLVELMPYLGRADSVCEARVLDTDPEPDDRWWCAGADGDETVRLLAPVRPIRRPVLEMSTVDVRKQRRTVPPETTWVTYARTASEEEVPPPAVRRDLTGVDAVRFAVMPMAPFKAIHGVLLADEVHRAVAVRLGREAGDLFGSDGAATDHQHAHWVPIPDRSIRGATIGSLVVWVPRGLSAREVAAIVSVRKVSGRANGRGDDEAYEVKGFPQTQLLLQAAGRIADVAPELGGSKEARRWRSLTPYLPVRHRKRRDTVDGYLAADVRVELRYRRMPQAAVTRLSADESLPDRWALEFRRYRRRERLWRARPGLGLTLEFAEPVRGPLLLGQLSHFGYGIFVPERE